MPVYTIEDGLGHLVEEGDTTVCGQRVSLGGLVGAEKAENPCPVCFPDEAKGKKKAKGASDKA